MSPILVRPVREQLEHDRVIRLLLVRLKRKGEVVANIGETQTVPVRVGQVQVFPDLVLTTSDKSHRLVGTVEVETAESVNHLEAMAQWAHLGRARAPFHLYVPSGSVEIARRLASENQVNVAEIWSFHTIGDQTRFTLVHRSTPDSKKPDCRSAASGCETGAGGLARRCSHPSAERRPESGAGGCRPQDRCPGRPDGRETRTQSRCRPEEEVVLPYLRFSRDKRGYEHTFVIHTDRRRGRSRTRILYWFRTPPGVKVGRSALDEMAIRAIEESNPEVAFDWTSILKEQGAPDPLHAAPRQPPPERRMPARGPSEPRPPRVPPTMAAPPPRDPVEPVFRPLPSLSPPALAVENDATPAQAVVETNLVADGPVLDELTLTPAHAQLGVEGVTRLRARHAEILARISERIPAGSRQDELKTQAERLNPDTWVTEDEVRAGIDGYEVVLGSLRGVVGQGRRRRRRRGQSQEASSELIDASGGEMPGEVSASHQQDGPGGRPEDDPRPEEEPV